MGVSCSDFIDLFVRVLGELGAERVWVVHGVDGLDEVSITGYTKVFECREGIVWSFFLYLIDFGLLVVEPEVLRVFISNDNIVIVRGILFGEGGGAS